MLPGLGFNELVILGVLALVVIGPKDLPLLLRKLGRWTAKLRGMAQEFRTGFDELARQAELDELKREVEALRRTTSLNSLANEVTKPLPTLEDYAGLNPAISGSSGPAEAPRLNLENDASPPLAETVDGAGEEPQRRLDEPLARSAP
ncbi:MAG: twin-arginine translocase subunit TatB [Hyphomonadaceae bacterium]|nr:twin-arginine translocase subunit TatB [Hyphomonadaceae bacterium]